ncbi:hypothetical protein [Gulosibacter sp. 10]|uniref:hypothetical protein n=1 Tax=Gulosibacter sp. 10 TaxID=1255570 RepID=UPI00097F662A|nr:hypothetical protein [Gulosibacter sp. 10]SJM51314.1 hypothetical protein FM112_01890 [Gulosibacter sp. 10]
MPAILYLEDRQVREDLATYLGRAGRIEDGGLRLQSVPAGVALWVPVLRPAGILTDSPLVMGVRGIAARVESTEADDFDGDAIDMVVPLRGMLDRLARTPADDAEALSLLLPSERPHESWAGVRPPLAGWRSTGLLSSSALAAVAEDGIAEVGERTSGGLGQLLAEQVRTAAWTRPLPERARIRKARRRDDTGEPRGSETVPDQPLPPAGAAFAAHALGFLNSPAPARLSEAPGWWRLGFEAGNVVIRRRD